MIAYMSTNLAHGTHHAYLLVGSDMWALEKLPPSYRTPSLDVIHHAYNRMGIGDVRDFIQETLMRPAEGSVRVFVVHTNSILHEAQNALLKLFEDPNGTSVFYLIIPREDMILPTLRSRFHFLGSEQKTVASEVMKNFLTLPLSERLDEIAKRLKANDTAWGYMLVESGEVYAHESKDAQVLEVLMFVSSNIHAPGASKKMLLEYLALSL